jgi:hypothetical protein
MDLDEITTMTETMVTALLAPEPMRALRACRSVQATLADEVQCRVFDARAQGATWEDIGDTLRITKQAAQQRFGD